MANQLLVSPPSSILAKESIKQTHVGRGTGPGTDGQKTKEITALETSSNSGQQNKVCLEKQSNLQFTALNNFLDVVQG